MQQTSCGREKLTILCQMAKLLDTALDMLQGKQSLHFTALGAINRIIDVCIVHKVYHPWQLEDSGGGGEVEDRGGGAKISQPPPGGSTAEPGCPLSPNVPSSTSSPWCAFEDFNIHDSPTTFHRGSSRNSSHKDQHSKEKNSSRIPSVKCKFPSHGNPDGGSNKDRPAPEGHTDLAEGHVGSESADRTPLEVLMTFDPGQVMNILHNSITMHKRIMGTRHKCTPSVRWRHCTHHCLQILSARVLTVMCHGNSVQHKVVNDGHIKTLVDSLDPNHDPVSTKYQLYWTLIGSFKKYF